MTENHRNGVRGGREGFKDGTAVAGGTAQTPTANRTVEPAQNAETAQLVGKKYPVLREGKTGP